MDPVRFFDALTRVVEDQVAHGAGAFVLHAGRRGDGSALTLSQPGDRWTFDEKRSAVWERVFARSGAQIDCPPPGSPVPLMFAFDPR